MGGVPLRETVVKQLQAAGVPVWHRLAPRHWHRHATGAELCFRAIFPSLAIAVQHNLQKHGTVACAKAISEQNCWILQRSIKCFSERLPACTTQPSLSTFLPTAFDIKFCKILWNRFFRPTWKSQVGLSVGAAEAEVSSSSQRQNSIELTTFPLTENITHKRLLFAYFPSMSWFFAFINMTSVKLQKGFPKPNLVYEFF